MTDGVNDEYNIQDIKRLFFDPQCGGSKQAAQAVTKLVEGYRAAFQYLNAALPTQAQREIEGQTDPDYWITPEQMRRQLIAMLTSGHMAESNQQKFRDAADAMGIVIPYEPGFYGEDGETDFRAHLADILAQHYASNLMVERAAARGGVD